MNSMSSTTILRRNGDVIAAGMAQQTILLNVSTWTYADFNETATKIWELLDRPRTMDAVVSALMRDYAVDRATCEGELGAFVDDMARNGFIVVEP